MIFSSSVGAVSLTAADSFEHETEHRQMGKSRIARVAFTNRPSSIELTVEVGAVAETSKVFLVKNGLAEEIPAGSHVSFVVAVKWDDNGPLTRQKGKDNVDVIILEKSGRHIDFQCSVITRKEMFYLSTERVFIGNIVRTRGEDNKVKMEFLPACSRLAYPGFSYEAVWGSMAESLLSEAKTAGFSRRKSMVSGAIWHPPAISSEIHNGWHEAVVLYFNMVTGTGLIRNVSGVDYFVHFNNIQGESHVPTLAPCTKVLFKPGIAKKPNQRVPPVNAVKAFASLAKPATAK